jgi:hypothetical protein
MMAGAGGAMRATGWRAAAIRFQQFGEGGVRVRLSCELTTKIRVGVRFVAPHRRSTTPGAGRDRPGSSTAPPGKTLKRKKPAPPSIQDTISAGAIPPTQRSC